MTKFFAAICALLLSVPAMAVPAGLENLDTTAKTSAESISQKTDEKASDISAKAIDGSTVTGTFFTRQQAEAGAQPARPRRAERITALSAAVPQPSAVTTDTSSPAVSKARKAVVTLTFAAAGAGIGAAVGGPFGAMIGAILGGVAGLFVNPARMALPIDR